MVYNTSQEAIVLPKNKRVGQCQLALQPNKRAYHPEQAAMRQEFTAENQEEPDNPEVEQTP